MTVPTLRTAAAGFKSLAQWWCPRLCVFCQQPSGQAAACSGCRHDYVAHVRRCRMCAARLPEGSTLVAATAACQPEQDRSLCAPCNRSGFAAAVTYCLGDYRWPLANIITLGKYHGRRSALFALGELLGDKISVDSTLRGREFPQLIFPVPLHARRERCRGFNQAYDIAVAATRRMNLGLADPVELVVRTRDGVSQTTLPLRQRRRNVHNAFQLVPGVTFPSRIAIVDDVMTSASTLTALATLCKTAGASEVEFWIVARASNVPPMT